MKYFILKRKRDGLFLSRNIKDGYIKLYKSDATPTGNAADANFYTEKDVEDFGKVWSNIFEFVPITMKNGYWILI